MQGRSLKELPKIKVQEQHETQNCKFWGPLEEPSKECRLRRKCSQTSSNKHQHGLWRGTEIKTCQIHTLHEKSCPMELSLLVQLPCPGKQDTGETLKTGKSSCHVHVIAGLEYFTSCR